MTCYRLTLGDWQRHGYIGGTPMPLGMIPNLPPDAMIPQMSSSSHLPAMIGQLPLPQQKILAINNAMYDPSLQVGTSTPNPLLSSLLVALKNNCKAEDDL